MKPGNLPVSRAERERYQSGGADRKSEDGYSRLMRSAVRRSASFVPVLGKAPYD